MTLPLTRRWVGRNAPRWHPSHSICKLAVNRGEYRPINRFLCFLGPVTVTVTFVEVTNP
jgi:hypothetical protein